MAIDAQYIKDHFPEYAATDAAFIDLFIPIAKEYVTAATWGAKYDFAHALYTAHLMKMMSTKGVGQGQISSSKVGDLARSYAVPSQASLQLTGYGNLFYELMRSLIITPILATPSANP